MRNLPILLLLWVAVCSAYPLDRAARVKEDSMELVQVIKGPVLTSLMARWGN